MLYRQGSYRNLRLGCQMKFHHLHRSNPRLLHSVVQKHQTVSFSKAIDLNPSNQYVRMLDSILQQDRCMPNTKSTAILDPFGRKTYHLLHRSNPRILHSTIIKQRKEVPISSMMVRSIKASRTSSNQRTAVGQHSPTRPLHAEYAEHCDPWPIWS